MTSEEEAAIVEDCYWNKTEECSCIIHYWDGRVREFSFDNQDETHIERMEEASRESHIHDVEKWLDYISGL